jgi:hypothetical protein
LVAQGKILTSNEARLTMACMTTDYLERMWQRGQEHLAAMRYAAAVRDLEAAEGAAWRRGDGVALARVYLPLLEARRQIRYQAAEGTLVICSPAASLHEERATVNTFLQDARIKAGSILIIAGSGATHRKLHHLRRALEFAGAVKYAARSTGRWLESLLLLSHGDETRIVSPADPTFAAGLPITRESGAALSTTTDPALAIPLPPAGRYTAKDAAHPVAREGLIFAWEALALKWQQRHPPFATGTPWEEMAWLRLALRIDPACEPITMRLVALSEASAREPRIT